MLNVKRKFERLEKLQRDVNAKLDTIENKFEKGENWIQFNLNSDKSKLKNDLENILNHRFYSEKQNNLNYLKLYEELSKNKTKKSKHITRESKQNRDTPKEVCEKGVETEKLTLLTLQNNANCSITTENKALIHKKQNNFFKNELVNLKVKLNDLKNKNKVLGSLLEDDKSVKNCKLLEKIITGFVERLAINWDDITELIIDDLLEQEIYNLNEIELKKIQNEFPVNVDNLIGENVTNNTFTADRESLYEINKLISAFKKEEELINSKYL